MALHIEDINIKPEKKTADVWDAVTETTVGGDADTDTAVHLKTYILNEKGNSVGKTETDFIVKAGSGTLVLQSVLTYSPVINEPIYKTVCELYADGSLCDKKEKALTFPL